MKIIMRIKWNKNEAKKIKRKKYKQLFEMKLNNICLKLISIAEISHVFGCLLLD